MDLTLNEMTEQMTYKIRQVMSKAQARGVYFLIYDIILIKCKPAGPEGSRHRGPDGEALVQDPAAVASQGQSRAPGTLPTCSRAGQVCQVGGGDWVSLAGGPAPASAPSSRSCEASKGRGGSGSRVLLGQNPHQPDPG